MTLRLSGKGCAAPWTGRAWFVTLAMTVVASLVLVAGASAATVRVALDGSMTVTADPPGGDSAIAISLSGVAGDLGQGNPAGTITQTYPSPPSGAPVGVLHGDVSQGCVRLLGNRAIVVGTLPPGEQWDVPGFGHIDRAGAFLEDNGAGAGDRARAVIFRSIANPCSPTNTGIWDVVANALTSLDAGGVSFGYTDGGSSPATGVAVVDPNGLSVAVTDAPDPDGMSVAVGAGSGFAELNSCGQQVNVNAASTVVLTCASLITEVITGSAEVVLGDGLTTVSIPEGGKVEVTDAGNGSFSVENLGETDVVVTIGNVETTIEPDDPPFAGWVSSSAQLEQVVADLGALAAGGSAKARDKLEDVVEKVDKALAKLESASPDRQGAAGELEGAVSDLQAAVKDRLVANGVGASLMTEIAGAARLLAESAIVGAQARSGSAGKIAEAQTALAAGDARLSSGRFKDAVAKYKDAISKGEGA
jgi:hypothetical protein